MRIFRFLTFVILFVVGITSFVQAVGNNDIEYAKNYLIILVHGIGDDHGCFDNVKKYLEDNGLQGYVYAYEFSDKFLNIEKEGWEFGDRSYDNPEAVSKRSDLIDQTGRDPSKRRDWEITKRENNGLGGSGKCWLEQAKEDFRWWFKKDGPGKAVKPDGRFPEANEIPQKFIVIAHSMGGLAVRHYIYGKDKNGQRYYQGDIEKVVYIDVPHLGSTAGKAAIFAENNASTRYLLPAAALSLTFNPANANNPLLQNITACSAGYALAGSATFDVIKDILKRHKTPALADMLPGSFFLQEVNSASLGNFPSIRQQIIIGRGVATASDVSNLEAYITNWIIYERVAASVMNAVFDDDLSTWEEKMVSINSTILSGYPFYDDGDVVVTTRSQKGEGVANLSEAKRQEYQFRSDSIAAGETVANAVLLVGIFVPFPLNVLSAVAATTLTYQAALAASYLLADQLQFQAMLGRSEGGQDITYYNTRREFAGLEMSRRNTFGKVGLSLIDRNFKVAVEVSRALIDLSGQGGLFSENLPDLISDIDNVGVMKKSGNRASVLGIYEVKGGSVVF